jgi:hypothetical protein
MASALRFDSHARAGIEHAYELARCDLEKKQSNMGVFFGISLTFSGFWLKSF